MRRLFLAIRVGIPPELEVDAPDVVRLPVQQRRLPGMKRRIEPEPALGRKVRLHVDIGDQEAIAEHLPFRFEAEHRTHRTLGAVADDQPLARELIFAFRCCDPHQHVFLARRDGNDLVPPANLRLRKLTEPVDQAFLEMVLLQVDERRAVMAGLRQQVERIDLLVAEEDPAHFPFHALANDSLAAAETIEDFERTFRIADRARPDADGVVLVEHDDRNVLLCEIDRRSESDGPCADDDHRPALRRSVLVR